MADGQNPFSAELSSEINYNGKREELERERLSDTIKEWDYRQSLTGRDRD